MSRGAAVFDLDGTLLDTLDDIADASNAVLQAIGCDIHPNSAYREFVGEGVTRLFEQALPAGQATKETLARCSDGFHREYQLRWNAKTQLYAGVDRMLASLSKEGVPLGVLSNKPHAFTVQCTEHYLARWRFQCIFGVRPERPRKPDPAVLLEMLEIMGVAPDCCLYVGDTPVDMQTARAAGCIAIGAAWGFRPEEQLRAHGTNHIAAEPEEVLAIYANTLGRR